MHSSQPYDPAIFLPWAKFNGIRFNDDLITIKDIGGEKGYGLVADKAISTLESVRHGEEAHAECEVVNGPVSAGEDAVVVLLSVPKDLVLSLGLVEEHAKSDRDLRAVLEVVGDFGKTPRGAILMFLLVQLTHLSTETEVKQSTITSSSAATPRTELSSRLSNSIGVSHPLTHYVRSLLPTPVPLPTFYNSSEHEILFGTSLDDALEHKLLALEREFEHIREKTSSIPWCSQIWWKSLEDGDDDQTTPGIQNESSMNKGFDFNDFLRLDALYRSRALDLPGTGHAMVPCIDMANHASRAHTKALYETDEDGNAVLILAVRIKSVQKGEEITISYGDDKGASEMVYSYGFIEQDTASNDDTSARQLFLDLEIPEDDPLRRIKRAVCGEAPGVRLFERPRPSLQTPAEIGWESPFIYWAVVNQEDGLDFTQTYPPTTSSADPKPDPSLQPLWQSDPIPPSTSLATLVLTSPLADLFRLRALTLLLQRVRAQLTSLAISSQPFHELADQIAADETEIRPEVYRTVGRLRVLEQRLLERAERQFEGEIAGLVDGSTAVREWFARNGEGGLGGGEGEGAEAAVRTDGEEDFS